MKLLAKNIDKSSNGNITLIAENEEDMWLCYNLLQVGDFLRCSTLRKVQNESATGSVSTKQVRLNLTIEIESIDFDSQASVLHLKGRNKEENQYVKMNAYHTLTLAVNDKFTITKSEWDTISLMLVEQATDPTKQADVAAIVMQDGLANICLLTSSTTHVRAKIEVTIPKKRAGYPTTQHDKGVTRFFDQIVQAIERHIRFDVVRCVIIASPGFLREQFFSYLMDMAIKTDNKVLIENKTKFMLIHSSTGHKRALTEVLTDPAVINKVANTKAASEVTAIADFYTMLQNDPTRAFYGVKHVESAVDMGAVDKLLISDALFRSKDIAQRKRYVKMVDSVKESFGNVHVFSSMHISGEQLNNLSGVAAILRFPMPDPESDDDDDDDEENELS